MLSNSDYKFFNKAKQVAEISDFYKENESQYVVGEKRYVF